MASSIDKQNVRKDSAAPERHSSKPSARDNLRGVGFMILAMFVFAIVDGIAKYLTQEFHPFQVVWVRQAGLLAGALFFLIMHGRTIMQSHHIPLQLVRGLCAALSAVLFIFGISMVPLADATAVTFVAPLFVVIIGALFLREPVGIHRWSAVIIGFIGTLLIIRPGFDGFQLALFLPLTAAGFFAVRQIISRYLASSDSLATTLCYTAITSFAVTSLPAIAHWQTPTTFIPIILMIVFALLGLCGEMLVIKALSTGLAVVVAPMHYTILIWTSLYGYLFFYQLPDGFTWAGGGIIIASGLYTLYREQVRKSRSSQSSS